MSRQRGRRERPAAERRAIVEKYSRQQKRAARKERVAQVRSARATSSVSWSAVLSGTLVSIVIYGLIATSIVQAGDGNNSQAGWVAVGAAALVPLLMFLLAFLTRTDGPLRTAAITSSAVLVVFVAGSFIARDIASGYVLAIGLGAAYAMRLDEAKHDRKWRLYTAVGLAVYTKLVFFISPSIAVAAAPMLPVLGISIVDSVIERRRTG